MSDTIQQLLLTHADSDRPALKAGNAEWRWRELIAAATRRAVA